MVRAGLAVPGPPGDQVESPVPVDVWRPRPTPTVRSRSRAASIPRGVCRALEPRDRRVVRVGAAHVGAPVAVHVGERDVVAIRGRANVPHPAARPVPRTRPSVASARRAGDDVTAPSPSTLERDDRGALAVLAAFCDRVAAPTRVVEPVNARVARGDEIEPTVAAEIADAVDAKRLPAITLVDRHPRERGLPVRADRPRAVAPAAPPAKRKPAARSPENRTKQQSGATDRLVRGRRSRPPPTSVARPGPQQAAPQTAALLLLRFERTDTEGLTEGHCLQTRKAVD